MQESKSEHEDASRSAAREQRRVGFTTVPSKNQDTQSWLMLSIHVKQLDDSVLNSLSAFSLAAAQQCYATASIGTRSRVGHSLGQLERLDFWRTDVLAGLLMQAFMLATLGFESSAQMLHRVSVIAAGIKLNAQELPQGYMYVPGVDTVSPGTEWLCLFWYFLRITVDWKYADPPDNGQLTVPTPSLADLKANLCAIFAANPAVQSKAFVNKQGRFWQRDCLASILFEALMDYVTSGQAVLDGDAIQQWLCSHSTSSTQTQSAGQVVPISIAEDKDMHGPLSPAAEPVEAATLHAAISELSSGFSIVDLARLEDQLLKHFQVLLLFRRVVVACVQAAACSCDFAVTAHINAFSFSKQLNIARLLRLCCCRCLSLRI